MRTYREVSDMTGLPPHACKYRADRYLKAPREPMAATKDLLQQFTTQEQLTRMATLSLKERAELITQKLELEEPITADQVRSSYAQEKIRFKKLKVVRAWRRPEDAKNIAKDEEVFRVLKREVARIRAIDGELIQVDESIFNQRQVVKNAWSRPGVNVTTSHMVKQEPAMAVVAAVSNHRGLISYKIRIKSFNGNAFLGFLEDLRDRAGEGRLDILLDNASIHKTKVVRDYAASHDMNLIWNVPYRPEFNGIEEVWAMAKRYYKKCLTRLMLGQGEEEGVFAREAIKQALGKLREEQVRRCVERSLRIVLACKALR